MEILRPALIQTLSHILPFIFPYSYFINHFRLIWDIAMLIYSYLLED